jgi:flagellar basal-body rod protein FlgC
MVRFVLVIVFIFQSIQLVYASDTLDASIKTSVQGMKIQNERLKLIAQNIANANTTALTPEEKPYTRKILKIKNKYDPSVGTNLVQVDKIIKDNADYILKYEPFHPAADESGYVKYPNVNINLENVDAKEAQRTYEANLTALEIARSNKSKIIELMK